MIRKNNPPLTKKSTVLFATFSVWKNKQRLPINGNLDYLRDFLIPKIKKVVIIDQMHPGSEEVMPRIEEYNDQNIKFKLHTCSKYIYILEPILKMSKSSGTQIRFKIRDFLSVIDWSFRDKTTFDYFIGLESINALAGIFLRKLGRVKRVVYYVSDYSPQRYPQEWFNTIYLWLDRFCAMHADYIWDVSKAMQPARISVGLDPEKSATAIHVPNGLLPEQIKASPISIINKHALIYMGTLGPENGPDVAIEALGIVLKTYPDAKLRIVGGTDKDFAWLKIKIAKLKLEKSVIFHGFIPSSILMSKVIRSCAIGLAPYRAIPGSPRYYADAGKIRAYCAAGIPVVSSQVPPLGLEVAERGAAIIVHDDEKSFADAILKIFNDSDLYLKLRKNAIDFAKYNTWENSFANAFVQM